MWLILLILLAICALLSDYLAFKRNQKMLKNIPLVSRVPVVGTFLALSAMKPDNLHVKFQQYVNRFGKTFHASLFGLLVVVTADVRYVETLLSSQKHIRKHKLYMLLGSWLGDGLLLSHGDKWQVMRKIITPTFHFKILAQFVEVFDRQSLVLIQKLRPLADGRTVVDIYPLLGLAMLDIITETAMGVSINAQVNAKSEFVQAVHDVTNILATRFVRPIIAYPLLFRWLTPSLYKKQREGVRTMHAFTEDVIKERRTQQGTSKHSNDEMRDADIGIKKRLALLDVLLESSMNDKRLSEKQIRDEVTTFMFEGHDTTTSATSFCLYLLSRNAQVQQKLFEEIRSHFGKDLQRSIRCNDLHELEYLNCVVKESLRLYPPIPAIGRLLKEDCKLCDSTLPAETNVIILVWQVLRDPDIFPEPLLFWPERHMQNEHLRKNPFGYIPFSAGPRNCIGQRFALYEMKTIVVNILRHYELLPLGEDVQPSIKIVLRSRVGVNFGITPRLY